MNGPTTENAQLAGRQGRQVAKIAFGVCIPLAFVHIALGGSPLISALALTTVFLGVRPVARYGVLNIGALLIFLVVFRYVGFPLVGKLMFGQPLDSNLSQPLGSFLVVLLGVLAYLAALKLASIVQVGKRILRPVLDSHRLRQLSIFAAAVGVWANLAVALRMGEQYTGITVANFFVAFLHLALITAVASALVRSKGRRGWDAWVIAIVMMEIAFALARNSRMALFETFLSYLMTMIAFNGRINWRQSTALGLIILSITLFLTPVMLQVRSDRSELSWIERIGATVGAVANWREAMAAFEAKQELQERLGFYLTYYGAPENTLERMSLINHVDVMKSGVDRAGRVGVEDLQLALERAMPRLIAPDKPREYSQGDWLYCKAGVRCLGGGYATVPLIANGYAAFGWAGAILYPLLLGLAFLLMVKKFVGWSLYRNVWAVYLLLRVHNTFVEGHSAAYVLYILRSLPQDLIVLLVLAGGVGLGVAVLRRRSVTVRSYGS